MKALWLVFLLAGCATTPRPAPPVLTIEEVCPDDEECPAATNAETIEFFRRYP